MYKVEVSPDARTHLKNIARYIAKDNPYKVVSFTEEMITNFRQIKLCFFPKQA